MAKCNTNCVRGQQVFSWRQKSELNINSTTNNKNNSNNNNNNNNNNL